MVKYYNKQKKNILNNWLEENANPEADKFVEQNLAITEKIHRILEDRNIIDLFRVPMVQQHLKLIRF